MGLPSGNLWAAVNLGAKQITDVGLYYQWGAVSGHVDATEFAFTEANYNTQQLNLITENLSIKEDAASVYFGDESIRMPSRDDFNELINLEYVSVTTRVINGVSGMYIQSLTTGNTLFFPMAMGRYRGSEFESTAHPHIWTTEYTSVSSARTGIVCPSCGTVDENRWNGLNIRPIKKL